MTPPKKKIVDKKLTDMIKKLSQIKQKSSSHVDEKGNLIQDKYNSRSSHIPASTSNGLYIEEAPNYEHKLINISTRQNLIEDESHDNNLYRKKNKKSKKSKLCRCKK